MQATSLPAGRAIMDEQLILGRYRLIERLAVGGSAEVWRAHDEQLDRTVAVKRLHPHLLPDDASRKRLVAEARAAAGLTHPVIVDVYDVDGEGESAALVMDLVEGESLHARIERDGPLAPLEAAAIAADLAEALFHAHQRGVIHRDVKPGNVLLGRDGRTRLVDFGIAHSLAAGAERLTLPGTVIGTLGAMAPEQLAGGSITPRTYLYGLGVVLHESLTGRPPYPAGSPLALARAQSAGPPPMDGVDPILVGIVAACLAVEPENRPLHAGALAVALRAWMAGDPTPAILMAPTSTHRSAVDTGAITEAVVVTPAPAAIGRAPAGTKPRWGGPNRGLLLAAAALAAGAMAVAIAGIAGPRVPTLAQPSPSGSVSSTISPVPTPEASRPVAMPAWAGRLAEQYQEDCGTALDPALIAGMNRKEAQDALEPRIDACRESRGEGD